MHGRGTTVTVPPEQHGPLQRFFRNLGPGLITGAADDDPSGISTYSVAGAAYGYTGLWTALFSFPLMAAVQLMCARLGMVTGRGLAAVIRTRYPPPVLWFACGLLIVANVFNIGADLGGMADATQMVTGLPAYVGTPFFAFLIIGLLLWTSYRTIARIFKWMTLALFAYVVTAFLARPDWSQVIRSTFIPHLEWTRSYLSVLVGILGTTISPYLFFWQAAQEIEEDRERGKTTVAQRRGSTDEELVAATKDAALPLPAGRKSTSKKYVFSGPAIASFMVVPPTIVVAAGPRKAAVMTTATAHTRNPCAVSRKYTSWL